MRFLSVFLPRLATDRILRQGPGARRNAPFAVWSKIKGGERIVALSVAAQERGLRSGMAVADARALCPALALEEHDAIAEAKSLEAIADWHRRFTPLAALDPPCGVMLDVTGATQLFGGEEKLLDDIESRLKMQGFCARTALAPSPALARALARFSTLRLVPAQTPQEDLEAIAGRLPVAALELPEPLAARLARAGLRSIGDLLTRPRAPLAARLGAEAMARLDALACRRRDPIAPRFEAPDFIVERRFPDGLTRLSDIEATLALLARDLAAQLERRLLGARRLDAAFYRVDGVVKHLSASASRPLQDDARIFALLRQRLGKLAEEGLDTGYGFDVLRLGAAQTERVDAEQTVFSGVTRNRAEDGVFDLVDRLGAKLGQNRVLRLYPQARHWPEDAVVFAPAAYPEPQTTQNPGAHFAVLTRPLRLLERAEPIETEIAEPEEPPLRFRWRRLWRERIAFEGPERIAPPWWRTPKTAAARDYFVVVDDKGGRFWLYRENHPPTAQASAQWFIHGLF